MQSNAIQHKPMARAKAQDRERFTLRWAHSHQLDSDVQALANRIGLAMLQRIALCRTK
jgi:hypothetical protein